jgi:hypothetical protein
MGMRVAAALLASATGNTVTGNRTKAAIAERQKFGALLKNAPRWPDLMTNVSRSCRGFYRAWWGLCILGRLCPLNMAVEPLAMCYPVPAGG